MLLSALCFLHIAALLFVLQFWSPTNTYFSFPTPHSPDFPGQADLTPEQIALATEEWVQRCKVGCIVASVVFVAWVVVAQVLHNSLLPPSLYLLSANDAAITGW